MEWTPWNDQLQSLTLYLTLNALIVTAHALGLHLLETQAEKWAVTRNPELKQLREKLSLPNLLAYVFPFLVYLNFRDLRTDYPVTLLLGLLTSYLLISRLQFRFEKNLKQLLSEPEITHPGAKRQLIGMALLVSGSLVSTFLLGSLFFGVTAAWGGSPALQILAFSFGALTGMSLSLVLVALRGPSLVRSTLQTSVANDIESRRLMSFSNTPAVTINWVENTPIQQVNIFASGWTPRLWPFKALASSPALFINRNLLGELNPTELRAVIAHELAHLHLRHLPKRLRMITTVIWGGLSVCIALGLTVALLFPAPIRGWAALLLPLMTFLPLLFRTARLLRAQELEADLVAVDHFQAHPLELESALRKIGQLSRIPIEQSTLTYPSILQRCQSLKLMHEARNQALETNHSESKAA